MRYSVHGILEAVGGPEIVYAFRYPSETDTGTGGFPWQSYRLYSGQ